LQIYQVRPPRPQYITMQSSNLLLLTLLCIATTTIIYAQQQQTLTPKARGLTIKEITKLIETETSEEFG